LPACCTPCVHATYSMAFEIELDGQPARRSSLSMPRSFSSFLPGRRKKGGKHSPPPMGASAKESGVTVINHGVATEDVEAYGESTRDDQSGRASMMEWLKDVLPAHLQPRISRRNFSHSSSEGLGGSPRKSRVSRVSRGGQGTSKTPCRPVVEQRVANEPMSAAEMMSEAHRHAMIKQLRAEAAAEREKRDDLQRSSSLPVQTFRRLGRAFTGRSAKNKKADQNRGGSSNLGAITAADDLTAGPATGGSEVQSVSGVL